MGRRPGRCYRYIKGKPSQKSKYCRSVPNSKIVMYDIGRKDAGVLEFPKCVKLLMKERENISSEALEAARMAINRFMGKEGMKEAFHMKVMKVPTIIVRINKMLTCAGADRLQTGMRKAFGKPCGLVCRMKIGEPLLAIRVKNEPSAISKAMLAMKRASQKFPGKFQIVVSDEFGMTGIKEKRFIELLSERKVLPKPKTDKKGKVDNSRVEILRKKGPIKAYAKKMVKLSLKMENFGLSETNVAVSA